MLFYCLASVFQQNPSRHGTFIQCRFNVGLPSATLAQHCTDIRWTSRVCWDRVDISCLLEWPIFRAIFSNIFLCERLLTILPYQTHIYNFCLIRFSDKIYIEWGHYYFAINQLDFLAVDLVYYDEISRVRLARLLMALLNIVPTLFLFCFMRCYR